MLRYVEGNPLRAKIVARAEMWQWCSLAKYRSTEAPPWLIAVNKWPVRRRDDWLRWVNRPQSQKEVEALHTCIKRGRPFGSDRRVFRTVKGLGLESTMRPRGRQRRREEKEIKDSRPL